MRASDLALSASKMNASRFVTKEVVEAAREQLVIGLTWLALVSRHKVHENSARKHQD